MAPQFYARYIPPPNQSTPANTGNEDPEAARPAKKRRKRSDRSIEDISALENINVNGALNTNVDDSSFEVSKASHTGATSRAASEKPINGALSSNQDQEALARPTQNETRNAQDSSREPYGTSTISLEEGAAQTRTEKDVKLSTCALKRKKKQKDKIEENLQARDGKGATTIVQSVKLEALDQDVSKSKHAKVLSKYQKSARAATKSAEADDHVDDDGKSPAVSPEIHGLTPIPQPAQGPVAARPSISAALPVWMTEPVIASGAEVVAFDSLPLDRSILKSLKAKGYEKAFTIQAAVLPLLLPNEHQHHGDLCISASTGSGKTLAYALPMVEALRDKPIARLRGLVVVPTRELVSQVREVFELFSSGSGLKVGVAHGSRTLRDEQKNLVTRHQRYDPEAYQREQDREVDQDEELLSWDSDAFEDEEEDGERLIGYVTEYMSTVDILVCTPGRLIEHLQHTRGFTLDHVQLLVMDEADRLLDESFQQWVAAVMPALEHQSSPGPLESRMAQKYYLLHRREVRKVILSATMTLELSKLRELKLRRPKLVVLRSEQNPSQMNDKDKAQSSRSKSGQQVELPPTLEETAVQIKDEENKPLYLMELLNQLSPTHPHNLSKRIRRGENAMKNTDASETSDSDSISSSPTSRSPSQSSSTSSTSSIPSTFDTESDISRAGSRPEASGSQARGSLIFTQSTASAHRLSRLLCILSPSQASKMATLTKSSARTSQKILSQFRAGTLTTIISTDRASRGLDIQDLAHVINYDMPPSTDSYIHRVGRTARAGKVGLAITLVGWREGRWFWNEIGRGPRIYRCGSKIARQSVKEGEWDKKELQRYTDALKQLGEETRAEQ
ncbi:MAG: hypothetical protein L6R39_004116 [Caloplaca ligustica]|nr:MAG: hypothetical protein L6R39_004116 [Caloplaca ligustica]